MLKKEIIDKVNELILNNQSIKQNAFSDDEWVGILKNYPLAIQCVESPSLELVDCAAYFATGPKSAFINKFGNIKQRINKLCYDYMVSNIYSQNIPLASLNEENMEYICSRDIDLVNSYIASCPSSLAYIYPSIQEKYPSLCENALDSYLLKDRDNIMLYVASSLKDQMKIYGFKNFEDVLAEPENETSCYQECELTI